MGEMVDREKYSAGLFLLGLSAPRWREAGGPRLFLPTMPKKPVADHDARSTGFFFCDPQRRCSPRRRGQAMIPDPDELDELRRRRLQALCRNCGLKVPNMPGGLCRCCYRDPAIRALHPPFRAPRPRLCQTSAHELYWRARNAGRLIRGDCPHGRPDGECPEREKAQRAGRVIAGEEDAKDE